MIYPPALLPCGIVVVACDIIARTRGVHWSRIGMEPVGPGSEFHRNFLDGDRNFSDVV